MLTVVFVLPLVTKVRFTMSILLSLPGKCDVLAPVKYVMPIGHNLATTTYKASQASNKYISFFWVSVYVLRMTIHVFLN